MNGSGSTGERIAAYAADMACLDMRFTAPLVLSLGIEVVPGDAPPFCDGSRIVFHEERIASDYAKSSGLPARQIAHCALHLMLGHCGEKVPAALSLAEDMAVEYVIDSLDTPHSFVPGRDERMYECERIFKQAGSLETGRVGERISSMSGWKVASLEDLFRRDDPDVRPAEDSPEWREMARQAMAELGWTAKKTGGGSGALESMLRIRNRKRHDYRAFLRRFMSRRVSAREDPSEFDPVYYSYGLSLYGNIPLVDSLESSDRMGLDQFVIAVDTSGSTMKGLVEAFLEEVFSVLRQTGGSRLHVIQCDDMVRRDDVIDSEADMSKLMSCFELEGGGGTDFRPVFRYVEGLVQEGEVGGVKGLMYFTDGFGTYPEKRPPYDVVFVFCDDLCRERKIPPWAMRLDIDSRDLMKGEGA